MAQVEATTERIIAADAETVFDALADYKEVRGKVLTGHFSEYEVREGGDGEGTLVHWKLQATSKRVRDCLLEVTEPTDGQLIEKDRNSSMVTTWTVTPRAREVQGRRLHRVERRRRYRRLLREDLRAQGARPDLRRAAPEPRRRGREVTLLLLLLALRPASPERVVFRGGRLRAAVPPPAHKPSGCAVCAPGHVCPALPPGATNGRRRCDEGSVTWWVGSLW
ncbi:SRPBCC family protein [Streptomyces pratensis]|nr:SRPBCC family protein [Streptomyces pratensis]